MATQQRHLQQYLWRSFGAWRSQSPLFCLSTALLLSLQPIATAQNIIFDGTLGPAGDLTGPIYDIPQDAGTTVDSNLFHSFERFNLDFNEEAFFESGLEIRNIFSRITGDEPSSINSLLSTTSDAVNLFLLNPNGILFGPDAELQIGGPTRGSFIATTTDAVIWPNDREFNAVFPENASNLLDITGDPSGFIASQQSVADITVDGSVLDVASGQSLLLLGGNIFLSGASLSIIDTVGGHIGFGSLASTGAVDLIHSNNQWSLTFPDSLQRGDITLADGTFIETEGNPGGGLSFYGQNINFIETSSIVAGIGEAQGSDESRASDIVIDAQEMIQIAQNSSIYSDVYGVGRAGDIKLFAQNLDIQSGGLITSAVLGEGRAGDILVETRDSVRVAGVGKEVIFADGELRPPPSSIASGIEPDGIGEGGNIDIITGTLDVVDGAELNAQSFGQGNSGNVTISARELIRLDQGIIFNGTEDPARGNGGLVDIKTPILELLNGGSIFVDALGEGDSGSVKIVSSNFVLLSGSDPLIGRGSQIVSRNAEGKTGAAGNINIITPLLRIENGALLNAETFNENRGGDIQLNINRLSVLDGGQIVTNSRSGLAGNIVIDASEQVEISGLDPSAQQREELLLDADFLASPSIRPNSLMSVLSTEIGQAGQIIINTPLLRLDNAGQIIAEASSSSGGSIFIGTRPNTSQFENIPLVVPAIISMRGNSLISATAGDSQNPGDGGNINVITPFLIGFPNENSDIIANAFSGNGGQINITANNIFNFEIQDGQSLERLQANTTNDVSASSSRGISGTVTLDTLNVDPANSLAELPTDLVDGSKLVAQNLCRDGEGSEFIVTGRGGLPQLPQDTLQPGTVWDDWRFDGALASTIQPQLSRISAKLVSSIQPPKPLLKEAEGWQRTPTGTVQLIAAKAAMPTARYLSCRPSQLLAPTSH